MARKLTGKEKTFDGEVIDLKQWQSGKGYFINLENCSKDFYGFGSCPNKLYDTVKITAAQGTGQFQDKMEVYKIETLEQKEVKDFTSADKIQQTPTEDREKGVNIYVQKQDQIVQECCLKAAAEIIGHVNQGQLTTTKKQVKALGKSVLQLKKMFYDDIIGLEEDGEEEENAGASTDSEP